MITANVLNTAATLNSFKVINAVDFYPTSPLKLVLQIENTEEGIRFIPPNTAIVSMLVSQTDASDLAIVGTPFTDDRSIVTFQLTGNQTENLIGGNILLQIDMLGDGTDILVGLVQNVLQKLALSCGC